VTILFKDIFNHATNSAVLFQTYLHLLRVGLLLETNETIQHPCIYQSLLGSNRYSSIVQTWICYVRQMLSSNVEQMNDPRPGMCSTGYTDSCIWHSTLFWRGSCFPRS